MLTSIPLISPVEVQLTAAHARRLLLSSGQSRTVDADYTLHEDTSGIREGAQYALDEIEEAAYIKEYHDSEWWRQRIALIKRRLKEEP